MPTTLKPPSRAAIYARISLDAEGEGKGVKRQLEDCRKLADDLGWTVVQEYVDNDISAFSKKNRPEYERMLEDIEHCTVDGVLIYNIDRLTRKPGEFEHFNDLAMAARIPLRCVTGDLDIGTEDGLLMGRIQAAFAAKESAAKSRRQKRKNDERAAAGLPHAGYRRPFGFDDDKITHRPDEVMIVRQMVDRYLAGESCLSITRWLNSEAIRTVSGIAWRSNVVRQTIISPRIAGLRVHRGEIIGQAIWKRIITPAKRVKVLAIYESKRASGRRSPRRYLLSALLRCALCEQMLYSAARENTRRYVCMSGADHGGCGKITITADPVEQLIADAVLYRLDTPELANALTGHARADVDSAALLDAISADKERLDELATIHGKREISMREWMAARKPIDDRIRSTERRLRQGTNTSHLSGLIGQGGELTRQWAGLKLGQQRPIIEAVLDHAVVSPGVRGVRSVDPNRVTPVWRL